MGRLPNDVQQSGQARERIRCAARILRDVGELMIEHLRAAADALNQGDPEPFVVLLADGAEWRGVPHGHLWWKRTPS